MTLTRFADVVTLNTDRAATLDEIRANAGNLSIPLYVRGKAMSEAKGEYAVDGLKVAIQAWNESSLELQEKVDSLLKTLEN